MLSFPLSVCLCSIISSVLPLPCLEIKYQRSTAYARWRMFRCPPRQAPHPHLQTLTLRHMLVRTCARLLYMRIKPCYMAVHEIPVFQHRHLAHIDPRHQQQAITDLRYEIKHLYCHYHTYSATHRRRMTNYSKLFFSLWFGRSDHCDSHPGPPAKRKGRARMIPDSTYIRGRVRCFSSCGVIFNFLALFALAALSVFAFMGYPLLTYLLTEPKVVLQYRGAGPTVPFIKGGRGLIDAYVEYSSHIFVVHLSQQ